MEKDLAKPKAIGKFIVYFVYQCNTRFFSQENFYNKMSLKTFLKTLIFPNIQLQKSQIYRWVLGQLQGFRVLLDNFGVVGSGPRIRCSESEVPTQGSKARSRGSSLTFLICVIRHITFNLISIFVSHFFICNTLQLLTNLVFK